MPTTIGNPHRSFKPNPENTNRRWLDFRLPPGYHFHVMRPVILVVAIACVIVTAIFLSSSYAPDAALAQSEPDSAGSEKQVIDNNELMELFFDPYYVDLRNSLKEAPEGRKEWRQVYIATYRLAEATNLLFSREGKDYMETPKWNALALESRTAVEQVGDAVRKLDYELTKSRYIAYIETCNNCHTAFELEEPTIVEPFIGLEPVETGPTLF